jgi:acyl-CoA thioesterase-1
MMCVNQVSRRFVTVGLLMSALAAAVLVPGPVRAADRCAAPADLAGVIGPLPHVAAVLKPGDTLNVLTVGSATVFSPAESLQPGTITGQALGLGTGPRVGPQPSASEAAFPMQMARDLRADVPGLAVNVSVQGGRGMTASDMLGVIHRELAANHYQLVIWQTGTVEAVRNVPSGEFYQTLSDGAAAIGEAGADLILVDPQFSRFLHANTDLDPYSLAMQQIAAQPGALLFHRFELMRYWASEGTIDLERTSKAQRISTVEALHACLGASLARMVAGGAHTPS